MKSWPANGSVRWSNLNEVVLRQAHDRGVVLVSNNQGARESPRARAGNWKMDHSDLAERTMAVDLPVAGGVGRAGQKMENGEPFPLTVLPSMS